MKRKMTETEMLLRFDKAIKDGHIFAYYQPQYNHTTGRMVGAEALMRWDDPEFGMQSPVDFIPVLENYRLIRKADLCMMKHICMFIRKCLDNGVDVVPISFNISRYDIYMNDYVESIETIRKKYDVPVKYLRAEITESSAIGGMELISSVLEKLHGAGYIVEMDDFGSGYSSLNVLKDLPVDVLKLDMRFLSGDLTGRGGLIVGSMVQMAKWLNSSTIAEGVETLEQADFMASIGCHYVQGYLYSKPLREENFLELLKSCGSENLAPIEKRVRLMDTVRFWNPESTESVLFSHYAGPASIFAYYRATRDAEILRVNEKYVSELGMNLSAEEIISLDPWEHCDQENREIYVSAIERAIKTGEEQVCETWRSVKSKCCGEDFICVRSDIRLIGLSDKQAMIYATVRNVTAEKNLFRSLSENEKKFAKAFDQFNAFAWEFDISSKEMRPCSRCRRELGLPALMENYPEPMIESGFIPPDYAEFYRGWHKQLADGADNLEAVIPLTPDRIPFTVRYTLERDENGRPLKAYGSAVPA